MPPQAEHHAAVDTPIDIATRVHVDKTADESDSDVDATPDIASTVVAQGASHATMQPRVLHTLAHHRVIQTTAQIMNLQAIE